MNLFSTEGDTSPTIEVYVQLLEEGTPTARGTQAVLLENGYYKLLPTSDYNPKSEIWEFPPGSIVKCAYKSMASGAEILLATEQVS